MTETKNPGPSCEDGAPGDTKSDISIVPAVADSDQAAITPIDDVEQALRKHTAAIHNLWIGLCKKTTKDIVQIGEHLTQVRRIIVVRRRWLAWLKQEFRWSDQTARNIMNVYDAFESGKFQNFWDLSIPMAGLYLLAAPTTSQDICDEIADRAHAGEKVTVYRIKQAVGRGKPAAGSGEEQYEASSDVGPDSAGETERKLKRLEELEPKYAKLQRAYEELKRAYDVLERENRALERTVVELQADPARACREETTTP
jgi:hypothetical protein